MTTGTIVRVIEDKGFGFISLDDDSRDVFFHRSSLHYQLEFDGRLLERRVTFELEETDKGLNAKNVRAV